MSIEPARAPVADQIVIETCGTSACGGLRHDPVARRAVRQVQVPALPVESS